MTENLSPHVLKRMVAKGNRGPGKLTVPGAITRCLPKAGEKAAGLPVAVENVSEETLLVSEVSAKLFEDGLLAMIEAQDGALGLLAMDSQVLSALIEVQTTGATRNIAADPRIATRTDAAMSERFINEVFSELEACLPAEERGAWFYGYRYAAQLTDRRKLMLMLKAQRFLFFEITLDLGHGAKQGKLSLVLPADLRMADSRGALLGGQEDWHDAMQNVVMKSPAAINAVIHRVEKPYAAIAALKVDDLITFPKSALDQLEVQSNDGKVHATARLGKLRGMRAIKIDQAYQNRDVPIAPEAAAETAVTTDMQRSASVLPPAEQALEPPSEIGIADAADPVAPDPSAIAEPLPLPLGAGLDQEAALPDIESLPTAMMPGGQ